MSSKSYDLISSGILSQDLSLQFNSNIEYISSNIKPIFFDTNPYIHYKFEKPSNYLADNSLNSKHLINNGGVYDNSQGLLLNNSNYVNIPSEDWNVYNDLTVSGWFKTQNFTTGDKILDFTYSPYDISNNVTSNLLLWLKFENNLYDSSGNSKVLTATNMSYSTNSKSGLYSLQFGTSAYLTTTNDGYYSPSVFTVCCWINAISNTGFQEIISCRSSTGGWYIGIRNNNLEIATVNSSGTLTGSSKNLYTDFGGNGWHHIVVIFSTFTHNMKFYIDGFQIGTTYSRTYNINTSGNFRIGAVSTGTNGSFSTSGTLIDDFRLYNRVLSQDEIKILTASVNNIYNNIRIIKRYTSLLFQVNNKSIYESDQSIISDNKWNHFIWNIKNSKSVKGYIKINNNDKYYYNQESLTSLSVQYPPYPMTSFENTFIGYTYRACSYRGNTNGESWRAFDNNMSTSNFTKSYKLTDGTLNITGISFGSDTTYNGCYIGVDLGQSIILDYYQIYETIGLSNNRPKNWKIYATNNDACWVGGNTDGLNTDISFGWVLIDTRTSETTYDNNTKFYVNKTSSYKYYAINVNSLIGNIETLSISEWLIFGYNPNYTIQQYPLVQMTNYTTTYSGIVYRACSYNNSNLLSPWKAFYRNSLDINRYSSATSFDINGILNISGVSFGNDINYKGIYLGIDMGQLIIMKYYKFKQYLYSNLPRNWKIYATNDDKCWNIGDGITVYPSLNVDSTYNWQQIDVRTQEIAQNNDTRFILDNNTPYRYYALHVNALIGGTTLDLTEWQIFGYPYYPYINTLGSSVNNGNIYMKDFRIHTSSLIDDDKIYGIVDLVNNNGIYTLDYTNSIILPPYNQLSFTTMNWNTSNNLSICGWFKTEGFVNGDKILEYKNDNNNILIKNNNGNLSFQYNNTSVYDIIYNLNNSWNYITWNISSNNSQGFISINNGSRININKLSISTIQYPPAALTGAITILSGQSYNSGTYITSASSINSPIETHYNAFNIDNSTNSDNNRWTTQPIYSVSTGSYLGNISTKISSGVIYNGEWLQIQVPIPFILKNYKIYTHSTDLSRGPKNFYIIGSNDGTNWFIIDSQSSITGYTTSGKSFNILSNVVSYIYYRLLIESNNGNLYTSIQEWEIYGVPLYPYKNTLGSVDNNGKLFISDFKILTTSIENNVIPTVPDDGSRINIITTFDNIRFTSNEVRIYNTNYVKDYPYLQYQFNSEKELVVDDSSNIKLLSNNGGKYIFDNDKNCLLLKNNTEAQIDNNLWNIYNDFNINTYNNFSISTWFKTENFKLGDKILDFYQDPSSYIQVEQYVKYPRDTLTSDVFFSSNIGVRTRVKAITNSAGNASYNLFDNNYYTTYYESASGRYTSSTGLSAIASSYFLDYAGDWIMVDLGVNIILKQIRFYPNTTLSRSPGIFRIYATNTVTNFDTPAYTAGWNIIHNQFMGLTSTDHYKFGQPTIININNNNSYRIYALVVNRLAGTGTAYLSFNEWELYGIEVSSTSSLLPVEILKYPETLSSASTISSTFGTTTSVKAVTNSAGNASYNLFDNNYYTTYYESAASRYTASTGLSGTSYFSRYAGDWIMIDLEYNIILKQIQFYPNTTLSRSPGIFRIYATNTVTNFAIPEYDGWDIIHIQSTRLVTSNYIFGQPTIVDIVNNSSYRIYALVVNTLSGNDTILSFAEWELYGIKEVPISDYSIKPLVPIQISGGDYYYAFTNTNMTYRLNVLKNTTCDILLVGGGGGGGYGSRSINLPDGAGGGGGGGGDVIDKYNYTLLTGSYFINVGKGGTGSSSININGYSGETSYLITDNPLGSTVITSNISILGLSTVLYAAGGGGGGYNSGGGSTAPTAGSYLNNNFSSGGGGGAGAGTTNGGSGNSVSGSGGSGSTNIAGGGGGAVGNGNYGTGTIPGNGGAGMGSMITGKYLTFGGGGAASRYSTSSGRTGIAYDGGGMNYSFNSTTSSPLSAENNRGGGGAGGAYISGGNGGSGIVIIRFHCGIKIVENSSNQLSFNINNNVLYNTSNIIDNSWNYMLWNIKNYGGYDGFLKINNDKISLFKELYSGTYINKLGSSGNLGNLYLSDFKIITDPITSDLEDRLYNNPKEYDVITDENKIITSIKNISALYYQSSKKLQTNANGVAVNGNINATGSVLSYYSDMRLKEIIAPIENPLEKIMKINTFKYLPNDKALSFGIENKVEVGVSAQDLNEVLPEVISLAPFDRNVLDTGEIVSKTGENYITVSYPKLVPLLIEGIKELNKEINKLQ